jgi:signal peptidase I
MTRASSAAQWLLRAIWFVLVPGLLAALWLRHALPAPHAAGPSALLTLAEVSQRHPVEAFVVAFLGFVILLRYWRFYLPFGYCLAHLPLSLAARAPRAALPELEAAVRLSRSLARAEDSKNSELREALAELAAATQAIDLPRLRRARRTVEARATRALSRRAWLETAGFIGGLGVAAALALLLRGEWLQNYSVLSSSMLPTFERGDQITADRRAYRGAVSGLPARGDVVIFQQSAAHDVVKRVIGLPGDEIKMRGGFPIINGWEVPHCSAGRYVYWGGGVSVDGQLFVEYLNGKAYLTLHVPPARSFASYVVKPGEVFVLGDNRNASLDSRNWRNGEPGGLPLSAVVGQVGRILASPQRNAELDPASLFSRVDNLSLNADNLDTRELQRQVQACVKAMPEQTSPPPRKSLAEVSQVVTSP